MNSDPLDQLKTLCNCDRLAAVPANHWPQICSARLDAESATVQMNMLPDLCWFDGHFPGQPVLPGVAQTHWACLLAATVFDLATEFSTLTRLKFKTPVLPGQSVTLELTYSSERSRVNYRYHEGDTVFSTGTVHFGHTAT